MIKLIDLKVNTQDSALVYSININARTFPDVRDGLKPVARRILWTMYDNGLLPNKPRKKSNTLSGLTLAIHPHGSASVDEATMKMAQTFYNNIPLVDVQGSFGTIAGDPPAASRYVEVRLSKYGYEFLRDIEKNAVSWKDNYDNTLVEPKYLPVRFPNLLINGSFGIGWGFISNIPPNNINEVIDMTIKLINEPETTIQEVASSVLPDFPTGGSIINKQDVIIAYEKGIGKIIIRGDAKINDDDNTIVITSIPFMCNTGKIVETIINIIKDKNSDKLKEIIDITDRSKNEAVNVIIKCKKGTDLNYILNKLYELTPLEDTITISFVVQKDNNFFSCDIKQLFTEWIEFRRNLEKRISNYDIERLRKRIHVIDGLLLALADLEKLIDIFKTAENKNDAINKLLKNFKNMTKIQADAIAELKLYQINNLNQNNLLQEKQDKENLLQTIVDKLSDVNKINSVIIAELEAYKKQYGTPRKTVLLNKVGNNTEEVIDDTVYNMYFTKQGYIKKILPTMDNKVYKNFGGKLNKDDAVKQNISIKNSAILLCFTNTGIVYKTTMNKIPEVSNLNSVGYNIRDILKLKSTERIVKILPLSIKEYNNSSYDLLFVTKQGMIKITTGENFNNINNGGLISIKLNDNDILFNVIKIKSKAVQHAK